jgi:8-oxo-dGTP pyrophosphatase MutT (NUDIX family)
VRECCEELGIDVLSFSLLEPGADGDLLLWFYRVDGWRGTINYSSEVSEIRWVSLNELRDLLLIPITREMIENHLTPV